MAWVSRGALVYNTRDGYALWLDVAAPAVNLAHALPSLFQTGPGDAWIRAAIWTAAFLAAWVALRIREGQVGPGGPWAFVSGTAVLIALMLGSSLAWTVSAAPSLASGASLVRYARALCSRGIPISIAIPDASRRGRSPDRAVWAGHDLAPGHYRVLLEGALNTTGHVMLAVGKPDAVAVDCPLTDASPGATSCTLALPAGARSLWVLADPAARRSVDGVDLDFQSDTDDSACDLRAERVISGGGQLLFVLSGSVYAEGSGGWIAGRAMGEFAAAEGAQVRVRLRNGEASNHVAVTSGEWRDEWDATPGETREIELPRPRRGLQRFTVTSTDGFRPGDLHRESRDWRLLGVWIEIAR
jgi:hypothetical protein